MVLFFAWNIVLLMLLSQIMDSMSMFWSFLCLGSKWDNTKVHDQAKKKNKIKLNIKRLLLLSRWVLLMHEELCGARNPAEMRPRGFWRIAQAGRKNLSAGPELYFSNRQKPQFVFDTLYFPGVNGIFAFIIQHLQWKNKKNEAESQPLLSRHGTKR